MNEFDPSKYTQLRARTTRIRGLLAFELDVRGDNRGWFKENYQKEKLVELGLPAGFEVVQNNISYNATRGVTRGIHAEPWDKYISIGFGSVFAAIVDFRQGPGFGVVETFTLTAGDALYVPRGCGNSFQTLEDNTVYTYLVNDHWSPDAAYTLVNLGDPELAIEWPIPLAQAEVSDKDLSHPPLSAVKPMEM